MRTKKKLSDSPGRLILQAVRDLEWCEGNPKYLIRMFEWHTYYIHADKCAVCLAGAVMAHSLGAIPHAKRAPSSFPDNDMKLVWLDRVRCGALRPLGDTCSDEHVIHMPPYDKTGKLKKRLRWLGRRWTKKTDITKLAKEYRDRFPLTTS